MRFAMKTIKIFLVAGLFMTGIAVQADRQPVTFSLAEEPYIDDIPFDTEEIAGTVTDSSDLTQFTLEEEQYIDDIPFNTEAIAQKAQQKASYEKAMAEVFTLKEEKYIHDIPFSTDQVALSAIQVKESQKRTVMQASIEPLVSLEKPVISILEIIIPIIIILGTLSYAVYEYILN
jgi:hypothetical protein